MRSTTRRRGATLGITKKLIMGNMIMATTKRRNFIISLIGIVILSLCLAFATLGGSQKAFAAATVNYKIEIHAANAVEVSATTGNPSYVYYDANGNGTHDSTELMIYVNNRFNPSGSSDAALIWTAPADGTVSAVQDGCTIIMNRGGTRTSTTPDGVRYDVVKLKSDYTQNLEGDYHAKWKALDYTSGTQTDVNYAELVKDISLKQGESIAVAINAKANNTYDEAVISAKFAFTPKDSTTATTYEFNNSWLTAHGNAIKNGTSYALFTEATNYFGWGALMQAEDYSDVVKPSKEANDFEQAEDYESAYFYEANKVVMGAVNPSYVYFNSDGLEAHDTATESFVYTNNRFNPSKSSDTGLWWTAPADGKISIAEHALMIELNRAKRTSTSPDGIRFAVIIAGADGSITSLTPNLWNPLHYTASTMTRASIDKVTDKKVAKGDRLAVIINCGTASNSTYDEAAIEAKIAFTPDGGTATTYTFNNSWITAQGNALNENTEYPLNGEATKYFGWGKVYLNKNRETFDVSKAYSFGAVEMTNMAWNGQRWYGNSICVAYPDKVAKTGKYPIIRVQPDFGKNVAATFTASEDCVASITKLYLQKSGAQNIRSADGVRWSIVYKKIDDNGEAKFYSVNNPVWTIHEIDNRYGKTIAKTHTDFPEVEMKKNEQLMIVFDNNKVTGYDTIALQVDLQYRGASGKLKTCNILDEVLPSETMTYEHWSFNYLKMGQDYSDTKIGEASDATFESVGNFEVEELSYDLSADKWVSYDYPDISVYSKDYLFYLSPDENRAVAVALKIGKAGRIAIDDDTFVRLDEAGASNGVRFRILKNDEIIYPTQNGWKYTRNINKQSVQGVPVLEIDEDDVIYFVVDSFGSSLSDLTECNFVVHFATDNEDYTESYIFSDSYSNVARGGWSYYSIAFANEPYSGVFVEGGSGCSSSVDAGVFVIIPLLATFAAVIIFRRRRNSK